MKNHPLKEVGFDTNRARYYPASYYINDNKTVVARNEHLGLEREPQRTLLSNNMIYLLFSKLHI